MKLLDSIKILLISILSLISISVFPQVQSNYTNSKSALKLFDQALYNVERRQFSDAINKLNKAISKDGNFLEAYFLLAEIYEIQDAPNKALTNYKKVFDIDPNYDPRTSLKLAIFSYGEGLYPDSKKYIDFFFENSDTTKYRMFDVERLKEFIYFAENSYKNPVDFNPINLGNGVNTEFNEYWPSLSIDETILVFTRLIPINPNKSIFDQANLQEDLFVSVRDPETGIYIMAFPMPGNVNTPLNEGAQCISADGKTCIITACNRPEGKGSCDLYIMFYKNGRWSEPENMRTINSPYWESSPSLSADGKTLYFASTRPGGYGKSDIWKVEIDKKGNAKGPAENLGDKINTSYEEASPHIHPDGQTLYFASDGHPGMGKLDLFWSKLDDKMQWQTPVNVGYPINTHGEERSLIVNGKGDIAMYASSGERGDLDIYYFEMPEEAKPLSVTYVKGYIYDSKTNKRLQAECELLDLEKGYKVIDIISDEGNGEYIVPLPTNRDYAFNVSKTGYLFFSENFSLLNLDDPTKPYIMNIPLQPIEQGSTVVLRNIFFEFNSYELLPESFVELNKVVDYMNFHPSLKIEIGGHTDNTGSKEYNKTLSENRARSVYNYLIENGISKDRLSYKGYDFSVPIADNDTEEGKSQNRRTEFKVISTK